jgi:hypothetical protein
MFPQIDPNFLEEVLYTLLPTFFAGAGGNHAAARQAALAALAAYDPQNEQELRLAAQITQYSFASLDAIARSVDPDLPLNTVLRLRGNANALQRSANQCQRTLDRLRKERRQAQPAQATAEAPQPATSELRNPAEAAPTPQPPAATPHSPAVMAGLDPATRSRTAPHPQPPAYPEEATVPWESMFRPLPPDAREPQPRLRPAA